MTESSRTSYLSPSPSCLTTGNNYHVFLSFHGPDTRKSFTDHLYQRLINVGAALLFVFRDEESLPIGEEIRGQLLDSIAHSRVSIPVLSQNYASSKWCLMELTKMMERKESSGHIVLPIFYKVKSADVKHQEGDFGKAFLSLRAVDRKDLEKWKKVLVDICSLKGWESEKFANGHEGKLVDDVVETVLIELSKCFQLKVPEHLVGMDDHVEELMKVLDISFTDARVIGVYGMPGVGKTTLAKLVYNELSSKFRYRSFIADIRESVEGRAKGIEHLQSLLIYDLLDTKVEVHNVDIGINILQSGLKDKKVLILLDDVTDKDQLVALCGEYNRYSSGSRIIITTQNRGVLNERSFAHKLNELSGDQPLLLFSRYAFRCDTPPREFEEVSRQVVATAGGLPLALQVIGSLLCGEKELGVWEDTLKKLRNVPADKVKQKLKLSYEMLDRYTQQIFLDIACFFIGIDKRIPIYMWDSCNFYPNIAINILVQRSLIKIGDKNEIQMHDQLRVLGREVVLEEDYDEPKNRSRVWDYDEALKVLEGKEGTAKTQAIHLNRKPSPQVPVYMREQFKNLPKLRFLDVSDVNFTGDFQNLLSELRWLQWKSNSLALEATNFHLKKLVILDLSRSGISEHWQGWCAIMMAKQLKVLNLTNCFSLKSTPDLSSFHSLEILNLEKCSNLTQIGSSIGGLKALTCLNLRSCYILEASRKLVHIPHSIGQLLNLSKLDLRWSSNAILLGTIGSLVKLKYLLLGSSRGILPIKKISLIGKLVSLTKLDLSRTSLEELPESIGDLQNLRILKVGETWIRKLPRAIGRLQKLQVLNASFCNRLEGEISEDFGELSSLEIFEIEGTNIASLPKSIHKLSSLRHLDLNGCKKLQLLPQLPSGLTSLLLTCESDALPQLSHLTHLRALTLRDCTSLESIPMLPPKLLQLHVSRCDKLKTLPNMSSLKYLSTLQLWGCSELKEIEGLEALRSLRTLNVGECKKLSKLDGLENLESLISLDVEWYDGLDVPPSPKTNNFLEIGVLDKLMHLEKLNVCACKSIKRLEFSKLECLKTLFARNCENLTEIRGLDESKFLEWLELYGCKSLTRLPELSCFSTLKVLNIDGCEKLRDIRSLENFSSCVRLNVKGCKSLVKLPDLSKFNFFEDLRVIDCPRLLDIPGLKDSGSLRLIDLSGCKSIETLSDLSACKKLTYVTLQDCEKLTKLQGLENLEELKDLDISGCKLLKIVPKLPRTRIIQNYETYSHYPNHGIVFRR